MKQSYPLFIILAPFIKLMVPVVVISNICIAHIEIMLGLGIGVKEGEIDSLLEIHVTIFLLKFSN